MSDGETDYYLTVGKIIMPSHCCTCATMPSTMNEFPDCPAHGATPPLVAASPVPPVVPDSEATDCECGHEWERHGPEAGGCVECRCRKSSGSGVVPDKPALAPATDEALAAGREWAGDIASTFGWDDTDLYVDPPAVTDDEAATAIALALNDNGQALMDLDLNALASSVVAALRSAGFLIVHPMQRGPEDPLFVMPDITAVHHTKET